MAVFQDSFIYKNKQTMDLAPESSFAVAWTIATKSFLSFCGASWIGILHVETLREVPLLRVSRPGTKEAGREEESQVFAFHEHLCWR